MFSRSFGNPILGTAPKGLIWIKPRTIGTGLFSRVPFLIMLFFIGTAMKDIQRRLEKLRDDAAECAVIGGLAETKESANCSLGSQSISTCWQIKLSKPFRRLPTPTPIIKTEGLQIWGTAEKGKEYRHIENRWRSLAESNRSLQREREKNGSIGVYLRCRKPNKYRDNYHLRPSQSIEV
jgi:hypothetical protein